MKSIIKDFWVALFLYMVTVAVQGQLFKRSSELMQILKKEATRSGGASMEKLIATGFEMAVTQRIKNGTFANAQTSDEAEFVLIELDLKLTVEQTASLFPGRFHRMAGAGGRRLKRASPTKGAALWPDATMPYTVEGFTWTDRDDAKILRMAMSEWEAYTCFKFKPKTPSDKYFTHIRRGTGGCMSAYGFIKESPQYIDFYEHGCRYFGLYLHELGHAMGLAHQHSRPDRDKYVRVEMKNVQPNFKIAFEKMPQGTASTDIPYDVTSVMHFSKRAFGLVDPATNQELQTIFALDTRNDELMGAVINKTLSFTDIKEINILYKCNKHCSRLPRCTNGGFVDKTCQCLCPDGNRNCQVGGPKGDRVTNCKNKHKNEMQCEKWAKEHQCQINPIFMISNCMKSCKRCHINYKGDSGRAKGSCSNPLGDEECRDLAYAYYCNINPVYMLVNCPQACGWCDRKLLTGCEDVWHNETECVAWSSMGLCQRYPTWMIANCRASCGACSQPFSCRNVHLNEQDCYAWASSGECTANLVFMFKKCQLACGMCGEFAQPRCLPLNEKECFERFRRGDCKKQSIYMNYHCRRTCHQHMCPLGVCENKHSDCEFWGKQGECHVNPSYMWDVCAKACKKYLCQAESEWPKTEICQNKLSVKRCEELVSYGNCITEAISMAKDCFRTCTRCARDDADCVDGSYFCDTTAHCINRDRWIRLCRKSCGLCSEEGSMLVLPCENRAGNQACVKWAKDGECISNTVWMTHNCREACAQCETETCYDRFQDRNCKKIKDMGECENVSQFRPFIAKNYCAKTCNLCYKEIDPPSGPPQVPGICIDVLTPRYGKTTTKLCQLYAVHGFCKKNKEIQRECYNTCYCETCFNTFSDDYCDEAAILGLCSTPESNKLYCAKSCHYCLKTKKEVTQATFTAVLPPERQLIGGRRTTEHGGLPTQGETCCDHDEDYCAIYAVVTCLTNELTRRQCPLSCRLCKQTCKDRLFNCDLFIDQCQNEIRKEAMEYYCAATCNFCKPCGSGSRKMTVRK